MTRQGNCRSGGRIAMKSLKTSLTTTWPSGYVESLRISSHLHSNGNKKPLEIIKSLWSNQIIGLMNYLYSVAVPNLSTWWSTYNLSNYCNYLMRKITFFLFNLVPIYKTANDRANQQFELMYTYSLLSTVSSFQFTHKSTHLNYRLASFESYLSQIWVNVRLSLHAVVFHNLGDHS